MTLPSLPHDLEAERAVLCCAMLDVAALEEAALRPEGFYHPAHSKAWGAALRLADASKPVDPITIADEVDGLAPEARSELRLLLSGILAEHHIPAAAAHHAAIVRERWVTRRAMLVASGLLDKVSDGSGGTELVSEALASLAEIETEQADSAVPVAMLAFERAKSVHEMQQAAKLHGYPTGVAKLDQLLGGLQWGIVTIVAGRPGMGKSALAMGITQANAEAGTGVHVFSLEDTRDAYSDRVLSRYSGVPASDMRTGDALRTKGGFDAVAGAVTMLKRKGMPWLVDDRSGIDAAEIVRCVRRNARVNGTRVVVVDYVQLLKRPPGKSMHEHMGDSVTTLADAAKRDGMAYVVLSQLNRGLEHRENKTPRLSDLRESGSLEERAKAAIALYREAVYREGADESVVELHVLKNNQGPTGFVEAEWIPRTTTIR